MPAQILNHAQSFGTGSQLWVIADDLSSPLLRKIDWYLNFQVTKARQHKTKDLSPELRAVMTENSLQLPNLQMNAQTKEQMSDHRPILILAGRQLPANFVMLVPNIEAKKWSQTVRERWLAMNKPTLRIFLPESISNAQFKQGWTDSELSELSIVPASP